MTKETKYYLATTGISEMWDPAKDIVMLGPWCKTGSGAKSENCTILPSPWEPRTKIKEAENYCYAIYEELIPELSDLFNMVHGLSEPERYWRILLGPWLIHFISVVYDRYARIDAAMKVFPDICTSILPRERCALWTQDTHDFISIKGQATTDYYNLKLFSLIIGDLYPRNAVEKDLEPPAMKHIAGMSMLSGIAYYLNTIKNIFSRGDIVLSDMYNVSYFQILSLEASSSVCLKKFKPSISSANIKYDEKRREAFKFKETTDRFKSFIHKILPGVLPACYLENYRKYAEKVKAASSVKAVGSAVGWYFNESFKFFAAKCSANEAKMVEFQHGGGYGTSLAFPVEKISFEKDKFYTWGWSNGTDKTVPLASPYLSRIRNSHKPKMENILFVGNSTHKYLSRFSTYLIPDDMPGYFEKKGRFFRSLSVEAKNILLYRPYQEIGWDEIGSIKKLMPGIKFLGGGKLTAWMKDVRLVIIDHQMTALLEALTVNVPSVCFWDHDIEMIRPEAESYFEKLRDCGILHKTPESAAGKVNEIYQDPMRWWLSAEVQKAKDAFCGRFALTSGDWKKEWIEALQCL